MARRPAALGLALLLSLAFEWIAAGYPPVAGKVMVVGKSPSDMKKKPHFSFLPKNSSTFHLVRYTEDVTQSYADSETINGFDSQDYAKLGGYNFTTRFMCITKYSGVMFSQDNIHGILGFAYNNGTTSGSVLKTLSQKSRPEWGVTQDGGASLLGSVKFAVVANKTHGELQLGGYDPKAAGQPLVFTPLYHMRGKIAKGGFAIRLVSIDVGGTELLTFNPRTREQGLNLRLDALFDTGSTCTILPSSYDNQDQLFPEGQTPFERFVGTMQVKAKTKGHTAGLEPTAAAQKQFMKITVEGGHSFNIPIHELGCVMPSRTPGLNMAVLGAPFFQRFMIYFDLSTQPFRLGFGSRSRTHQIRTEPAAGQPSIVPLSLLSRPDGSTIFTTRIDVGTPPQQLTTIFDTGSDLFAVRCLRPQLLEMSAKMEKQAPNAAPPEQPRVIVEPMVFPDTTAQGTAQSQVQNGGWSDYFARMARNFYRRFGAAAPENRPGIPVVTAPMG